MHLEDELLKGMIIYLKIKGRSLILNLIPDRTTVIAEIREMEMTDMKEILMTDKTLTRKPTDHNQAIKRVTIKPKTIK